MKVVAVVSPKGGVGKTTTSLGLCQNAAADGLKTLLIDYDNQASATASLVPLDSTLSCTNSFDLVDSTDAIVPMQVSESLYLVPASNKLNELERRDFEHYFRLRERLHDQFAAFDLVVIDTPAHLGERVTAVIASADAMYSPVELTKYSSDSLFPMDYMRKRIQSRFNPTLFFMGLVANRVGNISTVTGLPVSHTERMVYEALKKQFTFIGMISQRRGINETLSVGGGVDDIEATTSGKRAQEEIRFFTNNVLGNLGLLKAASAA